MYRLHVIQSRVVDFAQVQRIIPSIQEKDIRIIMSYLYEDKALAAVCQVHISFVFCFLRLIHVQSLLDCTQAIRSNLITDKHVWTFPSWYSTDWFKKKDSKITCTQAEVSNY